MLKQKIMNEQIQKIFGIYVNDWQMIFDFEKQHI